MTSLHPLREVPSCFLGLSCRCTAGPVRVCAPRSTDGSLVPILSEQFRHRLGRSAPPAEVRSWERSLAVLAQDLAEAGLTSVEVLVEYQLPLTSKRVDVDSVRRSPAHGRAARTWWSSSSSGPRSLSRTDDVCRPRGLGTRLHPVEQVRALLHATCRLRGCALATTLRRLAGVAYLHNATDLDVDGPVAPARRTSRAGCSPASVAAIPRPTCRHASPEPRRGCRPTCCSARRCDRASSCSRWPPRRSSARAVRAPRRAAGGVRLVMRAVEQALRANTKEVIVVTAARAPGRASSRCRCWASCRARGERSSTPPARAPSPRRCEGRRGAARRGCKAHVQVLQPVHRRRAERPGRPDLRRGTPDPGDVGQPIHQGLAAHGRRLRSTS